MVILKMSFYAPLDFGGNVPKNSDFQNGRRRFEQEFFICGAILTKKRSFQNGDSIFDIYFYLKLTHS